MNSQSKLSTGLAKCTSPGYNIHMSKNPALISMSSRSKWIHLHWSFEKTSAVDAIWLAWAKQNSNLGKKWASLPATVWAGPFLLCSPTWQRGLVSQWLKNQNDQKILSPHTTQVFGLDPLLKYMWKFGAISLKMGYTTTHPPFPILPLFTGIMMMNRI